jgi:mono/diheme cytochrome c family protein
MYIVDMYHGIIQEGEWTPVGSYLRAKIEQYQLDKVVSLGRIWRLTHESMKRDATQPRMYEEATADLVKHLEHANGWWRDMAQQVIVQRQDKSVAPALTEMARTNNNLLARFHALWALEGLNALDAVVVKELMKDENPRMRKVALWVSESLYKNGDKSFAPLYVEMINDPDTEVRMRAMMTGRLLKVTGTNEAVKKIMTTDQTAGVQLVGKQVLDPPQVTAFFGRSNPNFSEEEKALVEAGGEIYNGLCATCHGPLGIGTPAGPGKLMAPSLVGSPRVKSHPDYIIKTLLHGMSGDIEGKAYAGVIMTSMGTNSDKWIAAVASFVRANFENGSSPVSVEDVARVRKETQHISKPYLFDELWSSIPKVLVPDATWKITASHAADVRKGSTASAAGAFTYEGWTTGITQQAGMWFQIELPRLATISEIRFKSPPISRGWRQGSPPPIQTYPRAYDLEVSVDGTNWTKVTSGEGTGPSGMIRIDPVETKFMRLTLTASESIVQGQRFGQPFDYEVVWNMREMKLYGHP